MKTLNELETDFLAEKIAKIIFFILKMGCAAGGFYFFQRAFGTDVALGTLCFVAYRSFRRS